MAAAAIPGPHFSTVTAKYTLHIITTPKTICSVAWLLSQTRHEDVKRNRDSLNCEKGNRPVYTFKDVKVGDTVCVSVWCAEDVKGEKKWVHCGMAQFGTFPQRKEIVNICRQSISGTVCIENSKYTDGHNRMMSFEPAFELNVHYYHTWNNGCFHAAPWWKLVHEQYMAPLTAEETELMVPIKQTIGERCFGGELFGMLKKIVPPYAFDAVGQQAVEDPWRCPSITREAAVDCEDGAAMFVRLLYLGSDKQLCPFIVFCVASSAALVDGTGRSGHATTVFVERKYVDRFISGNGCSVFLCESTGVLDPTVFHPKGSPEMREKAESFYQEVIALIAPTGAMFVPEQTGKAKMSELCAGTARLKKTFTLKSMDHCVFNPFSVTLPRIGRP